MTFCPRRAGGDPLMHISARKPGRWGRRDPIAPRLVIDRGRRVFAELPDYGDLDGL
jgi:hypothetical protein